AEHEFRVAQMLHHENLIKIYSLETQTDWLFRVKKVLLLVEFVPGHTLDKAKAIPIKKLVPVFVDVAAGLVHMHRRGVYQADLKPGNLLLNSRTGHAKIIAFGMAWIKGENKSRVKGTPEYMAPETLQSHLVNEKSDIFNFGATMYRMVCWTFPPSLVPPPGGGRVNAKAYVQLLKPVTECNPGAPKALADLIHRCLQFV